MSPSEEIDRIPELLRRRLGSGWEIELFGTSLHVKHRQAGTPYRPSRHRAGWAELLAGIEEAFAEQGVARGTCLPLRWGRDTDLTISAVQALDPLLKDGVHRTYSQGFIPQPVVRFTAKRDEHGALQDGFLTSFVNISRVEPITGITGFIDAIDGWITVLSRLSLHARHLALVGDLTVWERCQVQGVTLRFRHQDWTIGDVVLLWNKHNPACAAVDLGSGLERLAWVRSREPWTHVVHGRFSEAASPTVLDALRTSTLLLGSGIMPTARGSGAATRRALAQIPAHLAPLGMSAILRYYRSFWNITSPLETGWPEIARILEERA